MKRNIYRRLGSLLAVMTHTHPGTQSNLIGSPERVSRKKSGSPKVDNSLAIWNRFEIFVKFKQHFQSGSPTPLVIRWVIFMQLLLATNGYLSAQNSVYDSIIIAKNNTKDWTKQVDLLKIAIEAIKSNDLEQAFADLEEIKRIGNMHKDAATLMEYYNIQSMLYIKKYDIDSVLQARLHALSYAEKLSGDLRKESLKIIYQKMGAIYNIYDMEDKCIYWLQKSDSLPMPAHPSKKLLLAEFQKYTDLHTIYNKREAAAESYKYAVKSLDAARLLGTDNALADGWYNIANALILLKQPFAAIAALDSDLVILNHLAVRPDYRLIKCLGLKAAVNMDLEKYDEAIETGKKAVVIAEDFRQIAGNQRQREVITGALRSLMAAYAKKNEPDSSLYYITYLQRELPFIFNEIKRQNYQYDIASTYEQLGQYQSAAQAFRSYADSKDSFYTAAQQAATEELLVKYHAAQKDKQIIEQQLEKAQLEKQIQVVALKAEYEKKKALAKTAEERQQLEFEEALKRQQIENEFARKQAALMADQQRKELIAQNKQQQQAEALKLSRLQNRQQWTYGIVALAALLAAGTGYYRHSRNRSRRLQMALEQEQAEQQLKEATYRAKLNDVSFAALRSQMNPHFIFNCLNSIKLYTEQHNSQAASHYLDKFARLIRNTLDHSRMEKVILRDEINSLELYLQMETMRFKDKLNYTIEMDENVEAEFIEIPPMLVQPYVENAIWHGLMHKNEGGKIRIHFAQVQQNSLLVITVSDNGIGRKKAATLKSKSADQHKSYGTKITGERIALINEKYGAAAQITIEDQEDAAGNATGTLVTIKLPV